VQVQHFSLINLDSTEGEGAGIEMDCSSLREGYEGSEGREAENAVEFVENEFSRDNRRRGGEQTVLNI
jgi:hypothetical protein